jgi:hypothetical protein
MQKAMEVVGITEQQRYEIFRLLAAILWLGNIEFVPNDKASFPYLFPSADPCVRPCACVFFLMRVRGGIRSLSSLSRFFFLSTACVRVRCRLCRVSI